MLRPRAGAPPCRKSLYPTSYVAEETIDWLDAYAGEDGERPFFLTASFPDPHHPFTPPGKYWDMYDPADFDLPESFHRLSNQAPPTCNGSGRRANRATQTATRARSPTPSPNGKRAKRWR